MSVIKRPINEFSKEELEESFWQLAKEIDKWAEKEGVILDNDESFTLKWNMKRLLFGLQQRGVLPTLKESIDAAFKEVSP